MSLDTRLTPSTNLTPDEINQCRELSSYETILPMERENGDAFYILTHSKRAKEIPPKSVVFLPSELMYLIRMGTKERVDRVFGIKKILGGRIVYHGEELNLKFVPVEALKSFDKPKKGQNGLPKLRRKRD